MNLFINAISKNAYLALFNNKREVLNEKYFEIKGNESSLFLPTIDDFLKENKLNYQDVENIVVVNGPGSFTGVRTIVLAVNTIAFIINSTSNNFPSLNEGGSQKNRGDSNLNLTPISYFDLFNNYPIIKTSSKRDSFFKKDKNSQIEVIYNDELEKLVKEKRIKILYGEGDLKNVEIIEKIDYLSIIRSIELEKNSKIEALYIKKPNIC